MDPPRAPSIKVTALGTEPAGPTYQEYGVRPEVVNRVAADLGAWDLALDAFSSGTPPHLRVCEKYWSAQDSALKKHWGPHQGLMWIHLPQRGHSKGGCKGQQGPLQGSVCRPYGLQRGGKYTRFGGLAGQHDLEHRLERPSIRTLRDSPCDPRDVQQNSTMWMGA